jgi:hypothetical protein
MWCFFHQRFSGVGSLPLLTNRDTVTPSSPSSHFAWRANLACASA